jgi:DNA-binding phage protein
LPSLVSVSNILLMNSDPLRQQVVDAIHASGLQKQEVARRAGISREMLYKFCTGDSDLGVSNVLNLLLVLGLRVQIVRDFYPLPKNHRQIKSKRQARHLARREPEASGGLAKGAVIGAVSVPDLGQDW